MSIFEYNEEAHMRMVRAEGREDGRAEGEIRKLLSQVRKKLDRGLGAEEIADIFEEELVLVEKLVRLIQSHEGKSEDELVEKYFTEQS